MDEDAVENANLTITCEGPYDYLVRIECATVSGDYSTTSLGATSIKDALERAATWLGE